MGVSPSDPLVFGGTVVVLLIAAVIGSVVPTRRAMGWIDWWPCGIREEGERGVSRASSKGDIGHAREARGAAGGAGRLRVTEPKLGNREEKNPARKDCL